MLSDDTRVKDDTWRILKITCADMGIAYVSNLEIYSDSEQQLLKELIKAQKATGDSQGKLEPTPNPLYTDKDKKFDPFEDVEMTGEEPTMEDVSPLHKKISEQEKPEDDDDEDEEEEAEPVE